MALTAAAIAGAVGSLASAGTGIAGTLSANQRGNNDKIGLQLAQLQDARNNEAYQQMLNTLLIQQARSGFTDSEGSSIRYDPATNTYVSTLGPQPQAARTAQLNAQIKRDTTDQEMARFANVEAMKRAAQAGPVADQTRRQFENYRPITGSELGDLLERRGALATNEGYQPIIQEALMQAARTGSAGGRIVADVGRQSAADLRKNAIESTITGMTGASDINAKNLAALGGAYSTASANANPSLQFPGIATDDTNKTMAQLAAQRAQLGVLGIQGAGHNANNATSIAGGAAGAVPTEDTNSLSRQLTSIGQQIPNITGSVKDIANAFNSGTTTSTPNAFLPGQPQFAPPLVPGQQTAGGFTARQVF